MSDWYVARALTGNTKSVVEATTGLVGEINRAYPNRDHASDGSIGDTSHSARKSEHNPCWTCRPPLAGVVLAVDIDNNGAPGVVTPLVRDVLEAAIGDFRVYYVIWNRRIYSRSYAFRPRAYTGSNPHDHHVHVSLLTGRAANDTSTWLAPPPFVLKPLRVSLCGVREQFLAALNDRDVEVNNGVGRIQHVLVHTQGAKLKVDGICGDRTIAAMAAFERKRGGLGKPGIVDRRSLAYLSHQGRRFGIVA